MPGGSSYRSRLSVGRTQYGLDKTDQPSALEEARIAGRAPAPERAQVLDFALQGIAGSMDALEQRARGAVQHKGNDPSMDVPPGLKMKFSVPRLNTQIPAVEG